MDKLSKPLPLPKENNGSGKTGKSTCTFTFTLIGHLCGHLLLVMIRLTDNRTVYVY